MGLAGKQGRRTRVRKRKQVVCSRLTVGQVSKTGHVKLFPRLSLRQTALQTCIPVMMGNACLSFSFPWLSYEHSIKYSLYVKHDAGEMQPLFHRASRVHRNQDERSREGNGRRTQLISTMHFLMQVFLIIEYPNPSRFI